MRATPANVLSPAMLLFAAGCGDVLPGGGAARFSVPIEVEGRSIGDALVDTGGGYELILREPFGLQVVDTADVLAFGGREEVLVTEGFAYRAAGVESVADFALVGVSVCDCNGLGFRFFRKAGLILGIEFDTGTASFLTVAPPGGVTIPFEPPPEILPNFDSSFLEVQVSSGDTIQAVRAVLDTGASITVLRRGLLPTSPTTSLADVQIRHPILGTLGARVSLFDTPGLPDLILGTNAMEAWGDRWYFDFAPEGGSVTVFRADLIPTPDLGGWHGAENAS